MIPYGLDPSLHDGAPHEPKLDDGFSRPPPEPVAPQSPGDEPSTVATPPPLEPALGEKSDF